MQVGCLGDIIFQVDDKVQKTLNQLNMTGSARIVEHQRPGMKSLTEFTGVDPAKISFNIMLSSDMGVDVEKEIDKVVAHTERGTTLPLVVGRKSYGEYRWQINGYNTNYVYHDTVGRATLANITVNLTEYLRV